MSDRDVTLMTIENDRIATRDEAIQQKGDELYYEALDDLAHDGKLSDAQQNDDLENALWTGEVGGVDFDRVAELFGEAHKVSSLDTRARERRYATLGRYIASVYETHVLRITEAAAVKAVA